MGMGVVGFWPTDIWRGAKCSSKSINVVPNHPSLTHAHKEQGILVERVGFKPTRSYAPLADLASASKFRHLSKLLNKVYEFLWFPNFLTGIETLVLLS